MRAPDGPGFIWRRLTKTLMASAYPPLRVLDTLLWIAYCRYHLQSHVDNPQDMRGTSGQHLERVGPEHANIDILECSEIARKAGMIGAKDGNGMCPSAVGRRTIVSRTGARPHM